MPQRDATAAIVGAGDFIGAAIAKTNWLLHSQPRDGCTHELDLRPNIERW